MSLTLIGKKIGMTQVYDSDSCVIAVTVLEVGPCPVTQVKTKETDGYSAVQIGFNEQKQQRVSKPLLGHFKKAGVAPVKQLVEFRCENSQEYKVGESLDVTKFAEGQKVDVVGTTKGKGFQGVMRRYNFSGQPQTHGHMMHRRPGSCGMRQTPGHIYKGRKMPGHQGQVRRTQQNLQIVKIIADKNLVLIRGSLPGAKGDTILLRSAIKAK